MHARSCRPLAGPTQDMPGSPGPPAVRCYICGRMFGTKSIAIHEPQCLKKWRANNDQLPRSERLPTPVRPEPQAATPTAAAASDQQLTAPQQDTTGPSGKLPCYLCGRELSVPAIYTHETQCLKKWRAENDRLPPNQRRPEPQRPDVKFTGTQHPRVSVRQPRHSHQKTY